MMVEKSNNEVELHEELPELEWKGGVIRDLDFVYEPLGHGQYVWRLGKRKGISPVEVTKEGCFLNMYEGCKPKFKSYPKSHILSFLGELPFRVPRIEILQQWVEGKKQSLPINELGKMIDGYVNLVLDLEEPFESKIIEIFDLHTWLRKVSEWAFNLDFGGEFGSGKTTALEAIAEIGYHTIMGTTNPAPLARMNEKYDCTWFIDEYDKMKRIGGKDSLIDAFIRQGDRRGTRVDRWNYERNCEESFDPFGAKMINYHTELETALKQRSLYHFKMTKSLDYRLPIINQIRNQFSLPLFEETFLWYMDNITNTLPILPKLHELHDLEGQAEEGNSNHLSIKSLLSAQSSKSCNSSNSCNDIRQKLYDLATMDLAQEEKDFLRTLQARCGQLGFTAMRVAKAIRLEGYLDELKSAMEIKKIRR